MHGELGGPCRRSAPVLDHGLRRRIGGGMEGHAGLLSGLQMFLAALCEGSGRELMGAGFFKPFFHGGFRFLLNGVHDYEWVISVGQASAPPKAYFKEWNLSGDRQV